MRTFEQERTRATVHFILTAILLCVAAFFYVKVYYPFRATDGSLLHRMKVNFYPGLYFGIASIVWMINWISVQVKYSRLRREFGRGGVFGKLLLFLELAGYCLVVAFLFLK